MYMLGRDSQRVQVLLCTRVDLCGNGLIKQIRLRIDSGPLGQGCEVVTRMDGRISSPALSPFLHVYLLVLTPQLQCYSVHDANHFSCISLHDNSPLSTDVLVLFHPDTDRTRP